uniref:Uncharacterized protein n=1 Tax=Arundo donax TaxID=35708 RepID=A0A0A8Y2C6_ARUDO
MPRCLLFMVPTSLPCHEEGEYIQLRMVLSVLLFSHCLLHIRCCFPFDLLCGEIIDRDISSDQLDKRQCYSWDNVLYGLRDIRPGGVVEHMDYPESVLVFPRQREGGGDEA